MYTTLLSFIHLHLIWGIVSRLWGLIRVWYTQRGLQGFGADGGFCYGLGMGWYKL